MRSIYKSKLSRLLLLTVVAVLLLPACTRRSSRGDRGGGSDDDDGFDDDVEHLNDFFAHDATDPPYQGDYPRGPIRGRARSRLVRHLPFADANYAISQYYAPSGNFGIPVYAVLDRELRIAAWGLNTDVSNIVQQLLAEPAPTVEWPLP
jgi:hypothetical protein